MFGEHLFFFLIIYKVVGVVTVMVPRHRLGRLTGV